MRASLTYFEVHLGVHGAIKDAVRHSFEFWLVQHIHGDVLGSPRLHDRLCRMAPGGSAAQAGPRVSARANRGQVINR